MRAVVDYEQRCHNLSFDCPAIAGADVQLPGGHLGGFRREAKVSLRGAAVLRLHRGRGEKRQVQLLSCGVRLWSIAAAERQRKVGLHMLECTTNP